MANEKDDDQVGKEEKEFGQTKQPPTSQQGQQSESGQQGQPREFGQQGQPGEFGQGKQGHSSTGQTDLGKSGDTDTPATY